MTTYEQWTPFVRTVIDTPADNVDAVAERFAVSARAVGWHTRERTVGKCDFLAWAWRGRWWLIRTH